MMTLGEIYLAQIKAYIQDFTKTYALIPNLMVLGLDIKYAISKEIKLELRGNHFYYEDIKIIVDFDHSKIIKLGYETTYKTRE